VLIAACGAIAAALGVLAAPTAAYAAPRVTSLPGSYNAPWQIAAQASSVLVSDGPRLLKVGSSTPLATAPSGGEIRGVAYGTTSGYAYATTGAGHRTATLTIATPNRRVVADLAAYERAHNPDGGRNYGIDNPSACVTAAFKALDGGPASYRARVDSHPVAVANGGSTWYVADAGANDVLRVDANGSVSLVATLPRQGFRFTARIASGLGMPSCVNGKVYAAEAEPTDVEVGPDGLLYVTVLPGLYDLGQGGSVYRIDPRTGRSARIVLGIAGASNVAVTSSGQVYVAELLAGRISAVRSGRLVPYLTLPNVVGLESLGARLYASYLPLVSEGVTTRSGHVVRIG
jgi:hypothetical protein